jgi:glutaredoxin
MTKKNHKTILYSRDRCHLCEVAKEILLEHGLQPEIIDIDSDPALVELFNTCVPVIEIDGKIRFRGRVDAMLLKRLLS